MYVTVLCGVLGGLSAELLQWFRIRKTLHRNFPDFARSWSYWIVTALMVSMGGVLVWVYSASGMEIRPIVAINLGASAPLLLGNMVGQIPNVEVRSD